MKKRRWPEEIKEKAKILREQGYSFGQLTKEFGVAKSTLHQWVRGLKRPQKFTRRDRIRWLKQIQPLGAQAQRRKREEKVNGIIEKVKEEVRTLSVNGEMQKAMLAMLYWSEGTKVRGMLKFANTDPRLTLLFITLLRQCYKLDESKFRVQIYIHWYHKEQIVKRFWSELLNIPEKQFIKTYHKKRSKEKTFRRNLGGICFLSYNSDALREQIVRFSFALGEKITGQISLHP